MSIPTEKVTELRAKHRRVEVLAFRGHEVIVKYPGRPEYNAFKAAVADEEQKATAAEQLFRDCCVYPEAADLTVLLEEWPFVAEVFAARLVDLAGGAGKAEVKKG